MNTTELFCGTKSFSNVAKELGHNTFTFDNDKIFNPTICKDILLTKSEEIINTDIVWASPPCETFSVASIGAHWTGGKEAYIPKDYKAIMGLRYLDKTIELINQVKPKYWFIENPRGVMRKIIEPIFKKYGLKNWKRETVTYCRYGDKRMKPTDIWTNCVEWKPREMCHNGNKDHEEARRGAKTGTQGLKGAKERGIIPPELFKEIFSQIKSKGGFVSMKVLIACEFSGIVREAFKAKGHDAWSCDLLPTEIPGNHIQDDISKHLDENWDLLIAHPPCTYLTVSGNKWFKPEYKIKYPNRIQQRKEAMSFFMYLMTQPIQRICVENPIGIMSTAYRKPDQIIQPWQFGHPETKATCLWLKGLPKLKLTKIMELPKDKNKRMRLHYLPKTPDRWKERSRTFKGIANAMAEQWGKESKGVL